MKEFKYRDLGTMATIGRNLAVVELAVLPFPGYIWMVCLDVHSSDEYCRSKEQTGYFHQLGLEIFYL